MINQITKANLLRGYLDNDDGISNSHDLAKIIRTNSVVTWEHVIYIDKYDDVIANGGVEEVLASKVRRYKATIPELKMVPCPDYCREYSN